MKIFVTDDDARILKATADVLRDAGHDVSEFVHAPDVLGGLAKGAPDLLITDVLMPSINGTALAQQAKALCPSLDILFISGDIGQTAAEAFEGHQLLAKPFTAAGLLAAVKGLSG